MSIVRRVTALSVACVMLLAACGGSDDGTTRSGSYLGVDDNAVTFLRWTDDDGELIGSARFAIKDNEGRVGVSDYELTGQRTENDVTLTIEGITGGPWEGRIQGSAVDLNVPQPDGTLQRFTFRRASVPEYNRAVTNLRESAENTQTTTTTNTTTTTTSG